MKKSELRQLIREELKLLKEANASAEQKIKKAMWVLVDKGLDDYPGGDTDKSGAPYLTFDSKAEAKKAAEMLKQGKIKHKLNGNLIDLL